jgi:hypothetical protein
VFRELITVTREQNQERKEGSECSVEESRRFRRKRRISSGVDGADDSMFRELITAISEKKKERNETHVFGIKG